MAKPRILERVDDLENRVGDIEENGGGGGVDLDTLKVGKVVDTLPTDPDALAALLADVPDGGVSWTYRWSRGTGRGVWMLEKSLVDTDREPQEGIAV